MTAKQEALNAIHASKKMLDSPEPLDGLRLSLMRATLDHALTSVEKIQEVKRARRPKDEAPT